jgi:hypothetical protein
VTISHSPSLSLDTVFSLYFSLFCHTPRFCHEIALFRHQSQALWSMVRPSSDGLRGETLNQSFAKLNSITLKPHCPEEAICAFKLRHNVIVRLLRNRCFAIKPFWNSKIDRQSEWPLVIDSQSEWPLAIDSQSEWPLVIPPIIVFLGSGYIFLHSSLFCHTQDHFSLIHWRGKK